MSQSIKAIDVMDIYLLAQGMKAEIGIIGGFLSKHPFH
jgi:hypothetical protein